MRKRVFKRWKNVKLHGKKRTLTKGQTGVLSAAACLCLILGMAPAVHGEEVSAGKEVVTNIYHRHLGSPKVQGGCYNLPIEHVHQGDEKNGGGCYTEPVLHVHEGSADQEGGCYTEPVEHQHTGDEASGGACYEPVYHEHSDDCEKTASCTYTLEEGQELYTQEDHCFGHGTSTFVKAEGTAHHQDCGLGSVPAELYYCRQCNFMKTMSHSYCDRGGEITEYRISCGREGEIEGYRTACGFEVNDTEGYRPGCGSTVDGYAADCGLEEKEAVGRLILTAVSAADGEKVRISARVEDLSGGKIVLEDDPYVWKDGEGNLLGQEAQLDVEENGDYSVTLRLKNKDVDESGLHSSILVDSIGSPSDTGTPSPGPAQSASPERTPGPASGSDSSGEKDDKDEQDNDGENGQEDGKGEEAVKLPEEVPAEPETGEENLEEDGREDAGAGESTGTEQGSVPENSDALEKDERLSVIQPLLEAETASVRARENMAENTEQLQVKQEKRSFFFSTPAVKVITLTAGLLFLLAGLFFLLFYLRHSVKVYNDDGEGRMICLGRCLVLRKDDAYSITITETMVEKSCTNRYGIKPGLFRIGRKQDQEMIVYKEAKKAVVALDKEMIVIF